MPTNDLSKERIEWILLEVQRVGSTYRKPNGSDDLQCLNLRAAQRRRFGGAYPKDLGATRRDQSITRDMYRMVELGHLELVKRLCFPGFVLVKRNEG